MSETITKLLTRFCEEVVFENLGPDEYRDANKTLGASHSKQIILPKHLSYYCNKLCFSLINPSSNTNSVLEVSSVLEEGILQPVAAQIPLHGTPLHYLPCRALVSAVCFLQNWREQCFI